MNEEALTEKQRETLVVLRRVKEQNGMPPTLRELEVHLGVTSNAVRSRLNGLAAKGFLVLLPRLARGIVLVEAPRRG